MPISIEVSPGNDVTIDPVLVQHGHGVIRVEGTGNRLAIGSDCVTDGFYIHLSGGSQATIGNGCVLGRVFIHAADRGCVTIADECSFNGLSRLLLHEPASIEIGRGSLLAAEIDITVSDMHSILDLATGDRINPARDVRIGERVWIGQRAMVLKGADIGAGSVIGACSVVTGRIPPNCVAAGTPARPVRSGVTWSHALVTPTGRVAPAPWWRRLAANLNWRPAG